MSQPTAAATTTTATQSRFKRATRERLKLRMAIDGPSGAGKSITAQRLAKALAPQGKIAVIDTESGSARKYVGENFGEGPIDFDVLELATFSPTEYTAAIEEAGRAGYEVIIIDSLSHAWEGKDGALELKDKKGGNSFTAWKDITPMHRRMIEAILNSPAHIIATMRSKTEYVLETDEKGKQVPRRVGVSPVQRAGMEYEFDLYGSLDWSHIMTVTKSRCRAVDGLQVVKPGAAFLQPVIEWLNKGASAPATTNGVAGRRPAMITDEQMTRILSTLPAIGWTVEMLEKTLPAKYWVQKLADLTGHQAAELVKYLETRAKNQQPATASASQPQASANGKTATVSTPQPTPAPDGKPEHPAITEEQKQHIKSLREIFYTSNNLHTDEARSNAWMELLKPYGVTSALALDAKQADELLAKLKAGCPF